ncbi:MAG: hypothetical protein WBD38_10845 [Candidatus Dormiibacterota bacterium]
MSRPSPVPGAVLVRSADAEHQLQGLRTALSLAMGDRPAGLYLAGGGVTALEALPGSEAEACLTALVESGVAIVAEDEGSTPLAHGARRVSRSQLLAALAEAEFQQTF